MHDFGYRDGQLFCENVPLEEIAEQVGTPSYVYSSATLKRNYRRLALSLEGLEHWICYAVKANSNLGVLQLLVREGAGFDIVSGGELLRVLRAGGSAARCTFAGVGKTRAEIEMALREGIYSLNVESEAELERIEEVAAAHGYCAPIAVRVNPDVDAGTHEFISTGKSKNKFGIGLDRARGVYERAAQLPHLQLRGVQTHIGSQIVEARPFAEAVEKLEQLVTGLRADFGIEFFSVGGGIGIPYREALASGSPAWWQPGVAALNLQDYAEALVPLLRRLGLRILFEPGRFITGNAGVLLTSIEYLKRTPTKNFAIVDAGMNDLIRPALYGGWHEIVPLEEPAATAERAVWDIVGPVCESGDFLAKEREMPPLAAGKRLAVLSAGAYGSVMGSNYNSRPLAAEVLVEGAKFHVVRRRQSLDDLLAWESLPA